jgi:hypothetical protein
MIADFVSFTSGAANDVGMLGGILTDNEKGRFHVVSGEEIEQFRSQGAVGTIIECHGDIWPIDVNRAESGWRRPWCRGFRGGRNGGALLSGRERTAQLTGNRLKPEQR